MPNAKIQMSNQIQNPKSKIFLVVILLFIASSPVHAVRLDELKTQIKERNQQIKALEQEIEQYRGLIGQKVEEAHSLKNEIERIDSIIKKLRADIRLTEKKIEVANLNIEELGIDIRLREKDISGKKASLGEIIKIVHEEEAQTLVEILLSYGNFSDFFQMLDRMEDIQKSLNINLQELKLLKQELLAQESKEKEVKASLEALEDRLVDRKFLNQSTKNKKNKFLKETKKEEAVYRNLLADRLAKQKALEQEIRQIEEQIRIEIDPASLPESRSGVLAWPLDKVKITQSFGSTPFATKNPQVYNGMGHNGIDLRASPGELVRASEDGTVLDIGNTDKQCWGVSYGKWVLIKHPNNLSTLYAHLSLIKVSAGQNVKRGQVVGYSGDTGYVTGPHLHLGVFASKAVKVSQLKSKICGTFMKLPMAPYNGYLNPLSYL